MKRKKLTKPKRPMDIALPENVMLPNGTLFVKLPTLDSLDAFWSENSERFLYAATGIPLTTGQNFLNDCEWVFGNSKAAVVETFCRWNEVGIKTIFYDWAKEDPKDHQAWFDDRDSYAKYRAEQGKEPERPSFYTTCTPETYRGYWILENLPNDFDMFSWFTDFAFTEITDWNLPVATAKAMLQEQTFDDYIEHGCCADTECFDKAGLTENIEYWKEQRAQGMETYGDPPTY